MRLSSLLPFLTLLSASTICTSVNSDPKPNLRNLDLAISVTFPDNPVQPSELNLKPKYKLVNGLSNKISIELINHEPEAVGIQFIGASLWHLENGNNIRNLTTQPVGIEVEADKKAVVEYAINNLDMTPQDVLLHIALALKTTESGLVSVSAYNATVEIIEQELSLLDPQLLFLYLLLGAGVVGTGYWAYNTWLSSVAGPKSGRPRVGAEKKKSASAPASVAPVATTTGISIDGAKGYDESWIPEHHLKKSATQRGRTGRGKSPSGKPGSGNKSE